MLRPFSVFLITLQSLCGFDSHMRRAARAADDPQTRKVTAADMPRIPHTDARDALKTFQLAQGFELELVAAEPLVADPVDACFDASGRMYVAEMHGYPFSHESTKLNPKGGGLENAGIIRLLEDTDADGRMDKSYVFADRISWPTSVRCYAGGVFVIAPSYLYYFKDTDGDNKADVREVVLSGFGRDNVQSVSNGLQWGMDNKLYFAAGRNPKNLLHRGKPLFPVGGVDIRFDPKTEKFEAVTGGLQFGHTMDDWGTRFVCSNSNHMQQVVFLRGYLSRNPYFAPPGAVRSVAADGASARVFRISPPEPWRIIRQKWRALDKGYKLVFNDQGGWEFLPLDPSKKSGAVPTEYPVGYFTSATGITIYRGSAYPEQFRGNAFVGDVGGNLVHRKLVDSSGVVYRAVRADENTEFVRSSDNWFRPVNFVNAPDGTLYILDMYRETVEHPYSVPGEIKKYLDYSSGVDRGRIYRLVSPGMKRVDPVDLAKLNSRQLVEQLGSANGWNRTTAQRLLWERQDKRVIAMVEGLLETSVSVGKLHALYTLQALGSLQIKHVLHALGDAHPRVRAHAIKLAEPYLDRSPELLNRLVELTEDRSEHVRFQLAFTLGESSSPVALRGLYLLARSRRVTNEIRAAIYSSVKNTADRLAAVLLADSEFLRLRGAATMLSQLGVIVGATPETESTVRLLAALAHGDVPVAVQQVVLTGIGLGMDRRGSSLRALISGDRTPEGVKELLARVFDRATKVASDDDQPIATRAAAIRVIAFASVDTAISQLSPLLSPRVPQSLQRAAVAGLALQPQNRAVETLLAGWKTYSPQVRRDVVDVLMVNAERVTALLSAVERNTVKRADVDRDKKQALMNHPDQKLRALAKKLFGSGLNSNRAKVVAEHRSVLDLDADPSRGLVVFKKKCAICHRVGGVGQRVAPDLVSVQNKSADDLLIAILDPNREAQPNFNVYTVVTEQGRILTGIIAAESASTITLLRAEAKQDVIFRSNIEQLIANGVSLMPEGLEKDLSHQEIADVIAFIRSANPENVPHVPPSKP